MSNGIEAELRAALTERAHDVPGDVEERLRGVDYRPRSRALGPRAALTTGVGLAATGGVLVAIVGLGARTSPAFAGWTATTTQPTAEQTARALERCTSQLAGTTGALGAQSSIPATVRQPVLTDTRGPFTLMILSSEHASATCFDGPSFTIIGTNNTYGRRLRIGSTRGSGAGSSQSSTISVMRLEGYSKGPIRPATQSHLETSGGQPYTFVQGQVVPGVTGVTLVRSDGSDVQATAAGGSFVAWWPGSAGATSAQIATSAGVVTQQLAFAAPAVGPCEPSSSSASSCTKGSGTPGGSAVSPGPEGSQEEG